MNREDVAMDVTVQNVEILRGRLEQAEYLLRDTVDALRLGRGFGWEDAAADRIVDFLASQQEEQHSCKNCLGVDPESCMFKHPEQAEGYFHHPSGGFVYNPEGLVNIVTPYYPIKRLVFPRDMVADFTNAPDEVIVRERPNKEPVIDIRYCTFKGKNEDGSLPLDYSGKVKMHGWTCYGPLQDEQAEGAQGEREAFEAAMKQRLTEEGYPSMDLPALLELNGRGDYASTRINGAWIGWQARAALAQPSPKSGDYSDQEWINAGCPTEHPSPAPELERPEVVARLYTDINGDIHASVHQTVGEPLMTVAQHDRIVAAWRHLKDTKYAELYEEAVQLEAERDAAKADLETERMRLSGCGVAALGYFEGCADAYKSASLSDVLSLREKFDAAQARLAELEKQEPVSFKSHGAWDGLDDLAALPDGAKLYAAPVAQAVQVPEGFALVPLQPTDAMRDAGNVLVKNRGLLFQVWRAMLAAAPAQGGSADE